MKSVKLRLVLICFKFEGKIYDIYFIPLLGLFIYSWNRGTSPLPPLAYLLMLELVQAKLSVILDHDTSICSFRTY